MNDMPNGYFDINNKDKANEQFNECLHDFNNTIVPCVAYLKHLELDSFEIESILIEQIKEVIRFVNRNKIAKQMENLDIDL